MKKRFGELLLERGLITPAQLVEALELQRRKGMRLGAALVQRGALTEAQLVQVLGSILRIKVVNLRTQHINPESVRLVSHVFASENDLFPFAVRTVRGRRILTVAMSDPLNYQVTDELSFIANAKIEAVLARSSDIDRAIRENYADSFKTMRDLGDGPLRVNMEDESQMTIVRRGGGEETIETHTGKIVSPFIKGDDGETIENPEVNLPPDTPDPGPEISEVMNLTEEVSEEIPVDPVEIEGVPRPPHLTILESETPPSIPTAPHSSAQSVSFDDALGALIDSAGGAVNAEAFIRLERKFWALMRVLAKKGLLTNEDFLRELGEEEN